MSDCAHCLSRRAFVANSTLLAVSAFLAGCSSADSTGPSNVNVSVKLTDYSALGTVGGIARLSGTSTPIAVVRTATSTYRAFSLICPHEAGSVGINGAGFLCSKHGATFNSNGTWTGGERTTNLREFAVTFDATAGTLTITS